MAKHGTLIGMRRLLFIVLLIIVTGCTNNGVERRPSPAPASLISATPTATIGAEFVPTLSGAVLPEPTRTVIPVMPSSTPSPTPVPTAPAPGIGYFGDPWALAAANPIIPPGGANCGLVDWFDFPLDPPDADSVRFGGGDFGVFRSRYGKFHAGEDWGFGFGGGSFGKPVHAIGHGFVTYAEPEGWGRDQGVIIVRHMFSDGRSLLSFYGHLDPPSFVVEAGDCVSRGQRVADIGRPRSSPHLHFEIRTHLPWTPGPGYWPTDPIPAGWLPPSQTILNSRVIALPGVVWAEAMPYPEGRFVAEMAADELLLLENGALVSRDRLSGAQNFRLATEAPLLAALDLAENDLIVTVDEARRVVGYSWSAIDGLVNRDGATLTPAPLWQVESSFNGVVRLFAGLNGDFLLNAGREIQYFDPSGRQLWSADLGGRLLSLTNNRISVLLTTSGLDSGLWLVAPAGPQRLSDVVSGRLAADQAATWVYGSHQIFQLSNGGTQAQGHYSVPDAYLSSGDALLLPDGRLLVAHLDRYDRRLLMLGPAGNLLWQRSLGNEVSGAMKLLLVDGQIYLFSGASTGGTQDSQLFWLDVEQRELVRILVAGSRKPAPQDNWLQPVTGGLLINIGGGSLLLFDQVAALEAIQQGDYRAFATRAPDTGP